MDGQIAPVQLDAGVHDHAVQAPARDGPLHGGVDVRLAGDVAEQCLRPPALLADLGGDLLDRRLWPVEQHRDAALLGDPARGGRPDPPASRR